MTMLEHVGVVGAGGVGQGIVRTLAQAGINVVFREVSQKKVAEAIEGISSQLNREIERWGLTGSEKAVILSRVRGTTDYDELKGSELVVEAIIDDAAKKKAVFRELDTRLDEKLIFTTNTSSLSVTELAQLTKRPDRFCGMHLFQPVHKRPLVEVVRGIRTSDETFQTVKDLVQQLSKTAIEVFESPGFVATRIILPLLNEAMEVAMEGTASRHNVDAAMKLAYDFPEGPLEMADRMGLDHVMTWGDQLFRELGERRYRSCMLLRKLVRAGHLGVKTGEGFFRYDDNGVRQDEDERDRESPYSPIPKR